MRKEGISITHDTFEGCRDAAISTRRQWAIEHPAVVGRPSMTLKAAIERFLAERGPLISPSTLREYKSYFRCYFQDCLTWDIFDPDLNWQVAITKEFERGLSAKTVRNAWGLCTAAMTYCKAQKPLVVLPRGAREDRPWLTYQQIPVFVQGIEGKSWEIGALLALHSLRLSEALAVRPCNISSDHETLRVRGARVLNSDGEMVYKELGKTDASRREVPVVIPRLKTLLEMVDPEAEFVYNACNRNLYKQVNTACRSLGLPEVGVHGLRHSFASLAYHLGWKELSTMQIGGWKSSRVVHEIYTHNADLEADIQRMKDHYKA